MYEIRNTINGKIYIGVHATNNVDDGYMGSGKHISRAIKKYGVDNFTKRVIQQFDTEDDMYLEESRIVDSVFLLRDDVYNLCLGGNGGWSHARKSKTKDANLKTSTTMKSKEWQEIHFGEERRLQWAKNIGHINSTDDGSIRDRQRKSLAEKMNDPLWKETVGKDRAKKISDSMLGRSVSDETRDKIAKSMTGCIRVTVNGKHKRIKKEMLTPDMVLGWK